MGLISSGVQSILMEVRTNSNLAVIALNIITLLIRSQELERKGSSCRFLWFKGLGSYRGHSFWTKRFYRV